MFLDTEASPHEDEDEGPPQEHRIDNDVVEESVLGEKEHHSFLSGQRQRKDQDGICDTVE